MPTFDPESLALWSGGRWSGHPGDAPTGFSIDSRLMLPGQVFVALKTAKRDGHDFIGEAYGSGASAAMVSRADPAVPLPQLVVADPLPSRRSPASGAARSPGR